MNTRFGYQALGLFQTEEELDNYPAAPTGTKNLGDLKYLDVNVMVSLIQNTIM